MTVDPAGGRTLIPSEGSRARLARRLEEVLSEQWGLNSPPRVHANEPWEVVGEFKAKLDYCTRPKGAKKSEWEASLLGEALLDREALGRPALLAGVNRALAIFWAQQAGLPTAAQQVQRGVRVKAGKGANGAPRRKRCFAHTVICRFEVQNTFAESEVEEDSESGEFVPTENALKGLALQLGKILKSEYPVRFLEACAESDDLLGVIEDA